MAPKRKQPSVSNDPNAPKKQKKKHKIKKLIESNPNAVGYSYSGDKKDPIVVIGKDGCEVVSDDDESVGSLQDFIVESSEVEIEAEEEKVVEKNPLVDISRENIITGKRTRKPVEKWVHPDTELAIRLDEQRQERKRRQRLAQKQAEETKDNNDNDQKDEEQEGEGDNVEDVGQEDNEEDIEEDEEELEDEEDLDEDDDEDFEEEEEEDSSYSEEDEDEDEDLDEEEDEESDYDEEEDV